VWSSLRRAEGIIFRGARKKRTIIKASGEIEEGVKNKGEKKDFLKEQQNNWFFLENAT